MKMHLITIKTELGPKAIEALVPSGTVYVTITTADHDRGTWEGEAEIVKVKEEVEDDASDLHSPDSDDTGG